MLLKENATQEKLNGRYFTPPLIADFITNWALEQNNPIYRILEPSCGDGIFLECLAELADNILGCRIEAIEIDEFVSRQAAEKNTNCAWFANWDEYLKEDDLNLFNVINDDFYSAYRNGMSDNRYQIIVGNPPYIRYQYLTEEQREEQSTILVQSGMTSNKLINSWVSFVVACVNCMDDTSKIGLVLPAELLQVKYAENLRNFLVNRLNRLTIISFRDLVFDGIEQEVVLLLGEKNEDDIDHQIRIIQYDDVDEMLRKNNLEDYLFNEVDLNSQKWTRYFLSSEHEHLIRKLENDKRFIRFSNIAKCEVGITTGNNDYFCLNRNTVDEYNLENVCRPLIARSVNIRGVVFTTDDWQYNIDRGAKTYLLDLTPIEYDDLTENQRKYIHYGEKTEQNTTYKCKIRNEWYKVPSVWVPHAFFLRRNYLYPKFMLNSENVNAVSTDTMHRIKFNKGIDEKRALLSYYNSVALAFTELEGRSYGGGVLEILPGEVGNILIPDIEYELALTDEIVDELVDTIDNYIRNNDDIIDLLDIVDTKILIEILGMTHKEVEIIRSAWLSLRERRLRRGGNIKLID